MNETPMSLADWQRVLDIIERMYALSRADDRLAKLNAASTWSEAADNLAEWTTERIVKDITKGPDDE